MNHVLFQQSHTIHDVSDLSPYMLQYGPSPRSPCAGGSTHFLQKRDLRVGGSELEVPLTSVLSMSATPKIETNVNALRTTSSSSEPPHGEFRNKHVQNRSLGLERKCVEKEESFLPLFSCLLQYVRGLDGGIDRNLGQDMEVMFQHSLLHQKNSRTVLEEKWKIVEYLKTNPSCLKPMKISKQTTKEIMGDLITNAHMDLLSLHGAAIYYHLHLFIVYPHKKHTLNISPVKNKFVFWCATRSQPIECLRT